MNAPLLLSRTLAAAGVAFFVTTLLTTAPEGLTQAGWHTLGAGGLMAAFLDLGNPPLSRHGAFAAGDFSRHWNRLGGGSGGAIFKFRDLFVPRRDFYCAGDGVVEAAPPHRAADYSGRRNGAPGDCRRFFGGVVFPVDVGEQHRRGRDDAADCRLGFGFVPTRRGPELRARARAFGLLWRHHQRDVHPWSEHPRM